LFYSGKEVDFRDSQKENSATRAASSAVLALLPKIRNMVVASADLSNSVDEVS
jgi:transketolase